eukprot:TRINITY_DN28728_c0_g1_i3.p1 TRINITY_DN28728_c0_g1~~TRINITY_DN28728_c0_g1_i3.p1  ORF type:complete len:322 (+),score=64.89 TRINITY_DN28728_c0_g1_i3:28-993(+)
MEAALAGNVGRQSDQLPSPTLRNWLQEDTFDCALNPNFLGAFAQLGCLGALQRESLLDQLCGLAGSSAGAMSGAAIASGRQVLAGSPSKLELHSHMHGLLSLDKRRWEVLDPALGFGIFKGKGMEDFMAELYLPTFEELVVPFACTAWSLSSLKTEILKSGSVPPAVRASMTVPLLFQPGKHDGHRFLFDGGIRDPSGSVGLRALPKQPKRALHVVVNRDLGPLFSHFARIVPPSRFAASRSEIVTLRLNNPPTLLFDEASFASFEPAILATASAVLKALDKPMTRGEVPACDEHVRRRDPRPSKRRKVFSLDAEGAGETS